MKKVYTTPEVEVVSLALVDSLVASTYDPTPEKPTRNGNDGEDIEFG